MGVQQTMPTRAVSSAGKLECHRSVVGVEHDQQRTLAALASLVGRLFVALEQQTDAPGAGIPPLLLGLIRAGGVDPADTHAVAETVPMQERLALAQRDRPA